MMQGISVLEPHWGDNTNGGPAAEFYWKGFHIYVNFAQSTLRPEEEEEVWDTIGMSAAKIKRVLEEAERDGKFDD